MILPAIFGMTGVWMAAQCTEILTAVVSVCLLIRQKKQMNRGGIDGR